MENKTDFNTEIDSLITKIKYIEIAEAMKDFRESDTDLIDECSDFILETENVKVPDDSEIKSSAAEIPFETDVKTSFYGRKSFKVLICAAVIFVLLVISCTAFKPFDKYVTNDGTFFKFGSSKHTGFTYSEFGYVPEGFVLVSDKRMKTAQTIEYEKGDLKIYIEMNKSSNLSVFINSENAEETGEIKVGKVTGYYCIQEDMTYLLWTDKGVCNTIMADNCKEININELVKIALSKTD